MLLNQWLQNAAAELKDRDLISNPRLEAETLASYALDIKRAHLLAQTQEQLEDSQVEKLNQLLQLRKNHIPMAYITEHKEFFGLSFFVNEDVLIPRPETEELVTYIIKHAPVNSRLIDIGTGSGCIAVAVKKNRPDIGVHACDVSSHALKVAKKNALYNTCDISFYECDITDSIKVHNFSTIVANLPYVPSNRRLDKDVQQEPDQALYSGDDGLNHYRALFSGIAEDSKASIVIEAEPQQETKLKEIAQKQQFNLVERSNYCYVFNSL